MVERVERRYKLLVVDDEEDVGPMFRQSMRPEVRAGKYQLLFANSGVEALRRLEEEPDVDLVITDIHMPEMDGLTLLGHLAERSWDLRSVVVSAYGDMKKIRTAMSLGAVDFVTKPLDFDDMRETIERTLRGLEQWREALAQREELRSLRNELDLAARIQRSVLPEDFPEVEGYGIDAAVHPAREVAGDFYDVMRLEGGRLGLLVGDVSDKGVPAALFMMSSRTLLRGAAIGLGEPARVLSEANGLMCEDNSQWMFATVFFCILDPGDGGVVYANAGHPAPVLLRADGSAELLESAGDVVLGLVPGAGYSEFRCELGPGETLFLYSDGVTEAMDSGGAEFGEGRLMEVLCRVGGGGAPECVRGVIDAVREFAVGGLRPDDITCVAVSRESGET